MRGRGAGGSGRKGESGVDHCGVCACTYRCMSGLCGERVAHAGGGGGGRGGEQGVAAQSCRGTAVRKKRLEYLSAAINNRRKGSQKCGSSKCCPQWGGGLSSLMFSHSFHICCTQVLQLTHKHGHMTGDLPLLPQLLHQLLGQRRHD